MGRNFIITLFWIAALSIFVAALPHRAPPTTISSRRVDLAGEPLYNENAELLGTVAEVVVNVENGTVAYLIARVDPATAFGTRSLSPNDATYVVIPWENVVRHPQNGGILLEVEQIKLNHAPHLTTLPDTTQSGWDEGVRAAWQ